MQTRQKPQAWRPHRSTWRPARTHRASGAPHRRRRVARHVRKAALEPAAVPSTGPHRLVAVLLVDVEVLGVVRVPSSPLKVGPGEPAGRRVIGVAAMAWRDLCCESRRRRGVCMGVAATAWRRRRQARRRTPPPRERRRRRRRRGRRERAARRAGPERDATSQDVDDAARKKKRHRNRTGPAGRTHPWYPAPARRTLRNIGAATSRTSRISLGAKGRGPRLSPSTYQSSSTHPPGRRQQPPPRHALLGATIFKRIRQDPLVSLGTPRLSS